MADDHEELDRLLAENRERRAAERALAEQRVAEAADTIDRLANPHETDEEREERRAAEAERARLARLGVQLDARR